MLRSTTSTLIDWMYATFADPVLIDMVQEYLIAQSSKTMEDCLHIELTEYVELARATDLLCWDSFVEGRLSPLWLDIMKPVLLRNKSRLHMSPRKWGQQFIEHLLSITHKQSIFRNSHIHFKGQDGLTQPQLDKIFTQVEELMRSDPEQLLPRHQHLMEVDFEALGAGKAVDRQFWIVSMESALSAARQVRRGNVVPGSMLRFNRRGRARPAMRARTNGSLIYRQTCR